jgi:predicted nucleotidyltransferase
MINNQNITDITEQIREYFKELENIIAVFLFGSFLTGKLNEESDLDIAVLFAKKPETKDILNMQNDLIDFTKNDIDLVLLNDASPILARQVIEKGKEIFCNDHTEKAKFIIKTVNEYDDLKYYRFPIEQNLSKRRIFD